MNNLLAALALVLFARPEPPLEPISVVRIAPSGETVTLRINAHFGGCGTSDDFRVDVRQLDGQQRLRIVRTSPDPCELYAPDGAIFSLRTTQVNAALPIVVENPVLVSRDVE